MVATGTLISAFWILSANSWMQTPTGYAVNADGQFVAVDWFKVIFNPSFPYRLVHMVLAAYLTTALVVGAVGAFHLLRDRHLAGPRVMFSMAMWMAGPGRTDPDSCRRSARPQHARASAHTDHGRWRPFREHPDGAAADPVWPARHERGQGEYGARNPTFGLADSGTFAGRADEGLDTVPRENWPPVR